MILSDNEKKILQQIVEFYESRFLDVNELMKNLLKAPNIDNLREALATAESADKVSDQYQKATELVSQLRQQCPDIGVITNVTVNRGALKEDSKPYHIFQDGTLLRNPKTLIHPKVDGVTRLLVKDITVDTSQ